MKPIFQFKNVDLQFKSALRCALTGINYCVNPGDFVILLGSNGSGKSSLIRLLQRSHSPTRGEILFHDQPLANYSTKSLSKKIAILSQNSNDSLFPSLTVKENFLVMKQIRQLQMTLDEFTVYLEQFNRALPLKLNVMCERLSGGERQALVLALYLMDPPEVLLLDEHTSALDPKSAKNIMELTHKMITNYRMTCLLTTHDLDIALAYGNRILVLNQGSIHQVYDKTDTASAGSITKAQLIAHYF